MIRYLIAVLSLLPFTAWRADAQGMSRVRPPVQPTCESMPTVGRTIGELCSANSDQSLRYWNGSSWVLIGSSGALETGFYDVRAYGAVCDGATDDSVAINTTITAASPGGVVAIPLASCAVASPIILQNQVALVGMYHIGAVNQTYPEIKVRDDFVGKAVIQSFPLDADLDSTWDSDCIDAGDCSTAPYVSISNISIVSPDGVLSIPTIINLGTTWENSEFSNISITLNANTTVTDAVFKQMGGGGNYRIFNTNFIYGAGTFKTLVHLEAYSTVFIANNNWTMNDGADGTGPGVLLDSSGQYYFYSTHFERSIEDQPVVDIAGPATASFFGCDFGPTQPRSVMIRINRVGREGNYAISTKGLTIENTRINVNQTIGWYKIVEVLDGEPGDLWYDTFWGLKSDGCAPYEVTENYFGPVGISSYVFGSRASLMRGASGYGGVTETCQYGGMSKLIFRENDAEPVGGFFDINDMIINRDYVFVATARGAGTSDDWDASATYIQNQQVTGSDNYVYRAVQDGGEAEDPTTDADNTYWEVILDPYTGNEAGEATWELTSKLDWIRGAVGVNTEVITGAWTFNPAATTIFQTTSSDYNDAPISVARNNTSGDHAKILEFSNMDFFIDDGGDFELSQRMDWDGSSNRWEARFTSSIIQPNYMKLGYDGTFYWLFSDPGTSYTAGDAVAGLEVRAQMSETTAHGFQFKLNHVLLLNPTTTPPACDAGGTDNGAIYMNGTSGKPCYCWGGTWYKFSDDTAC